MLQVNEAIERILSEIRPLGLERVDILSALGRVTGEDIVAKRPNPPWDNSAMDGYALKAIDTKGATPESPATLAVAYDLPAGRTPRRPIKEGEAVRIMTGAPVPQGADAVAMVEYTEDAGPGKVAIKREARAGENIRRAGEDFSSGEVVIKKGSIVRAQEVSMLATVGRPHVKVFQRPRVAVLSTGDELVDIDEEPGPGKIPDSNSYALSALVRECGAVAVHLPIARDNRTSLEELLRSAATCDCIISSGGVSVGDFDFVKEVLKDLGSEMMFWKVAIKPGKPLAFGVISGKPAFGLPGNPVSSMVAFHEFVRPALLRMAGRKNIFTAAFEALLTGDIRKKPGRTNFIRALTVYSRGAFHTTPLDGQGSGVISTSVKSNSYIVVPAEVAELKKGQRVKVQPADPYFLYSEVF